MWVSFLAGEARRLAAPRLDSHPGPNESAAMRLPLLTAAIASIALSALAETPPVTVPPVTENDAATDPFLWLEADSPRSLAWVEQQNARSLAVLKADPRYAAFHQQALTIVNAADRIAMPELIGRGVYNFWQDPANVRGLWRRTSLAGYRAEAPAWETVLDLDALSRAEKANWVWKGANCPPPHYRRCLLSLSDGGEDATVTREFDLQSKSFVAGFNLPRSKQTADYLDDDTLIVSRDWGPGTTTESSYPFVVKTLKRGQRLDQAAEVFRGKPTDVSVDPVVLHDADGHRVVLIERATDFFHAEHWLLTEHGTVRLALPEKVSFHGLFQGQLVLTLQEDWNGLKSGDLIAVDPHGDVAASARLIFAPTARQSVEQVSITAHRVVAAIYDNVRARVFSFEDRDGRWTASPLPVAENASASLVTASDLDDTLFLSVESFLAPTHLFQADAAGGAGIPVKALPPRFDASRDVVEQFQAASSDGTQIPISSSIPRA
jgi:prolyl oligopeptidase